MASYKAATTEYEELLEFGVAFGHVSLLRQTPLTPTKGRMAFQASLLGSPAGILISAKAVVLKGIKGFDTDKHPRMLAVFAPAIGGD